MKIKFGRKYYSRSWSNDELRYVLKFFPHYESVINVSGWKDEDKEGKRYRDYFSDKAKYFISNYSADKETGLSGFEDLLIDLDKPLPDELKFRFDIALNHTVLEHVRNPFFSFSQIAKLAKLAVITIVPFRQQLHFRPGIYGDYFRFTPFAMRELHRENNLEIIYESTNPIASPIIYLFCVGIRDSAAFKDFPRKTLDLSSINGKLGSLRLKNIIKFQSVHLLNRIYNLFFGF